MWDLFSGNPLDILTGDQAKDKRAAAQAWRDAGSTSDDVVVKSDNNTVDVVSTKMNRVLARIYITPPYQMNVNTCRVNLAIKRVAFFTTSNTFLAYEVDL